MGAGVRADGVVSRDMAFESIASGERARLRGTEEVSSLVVISILQQIRVNTSL